MMKTSIDLFISAGAKIARTHMITASELIRCMIGKDEYEQEA